jgi:hypothetical protein
VGVSILEYSLSWWKRGCWKFASPLLVQVNHFGVFKCTASTMVEKVGPRSKSTRAPIDQTASYCYVSADTSTWISSTVQDKMAKLSCM